MAGALYAQADGSSWCWLKLARALVCKKPALAPVQYGVSSCRYGVVRGWRPPKRPSPHSHTLLQSACLHTSSILPAHSRPSWLQAMLTAHGDADVVHPVPRRRPQLSHTALSSHLLAGPRFLRAPFSHSQFSTTSWWWDWRDARQDSHESTAWPCRHPPSSALTALYTSHSLLRKSMKQRKSAM